LAPLEWLLPRSAPLPLLSPVPAMLPRRSMPPFFSFFLEICPDNSGVNETAKPHGYTQRQRHRLNSERKETHRKAQQHRQLQHANTSQHVTSLCLLGGGSGSVFEGRLVVGGWLALLASRRLRGWTRKQHQQTKR
jgi:hypothetical protein